jgi:hypothetical protein
VTGLAFNTKNYIMEAETATHFSVILPFPVGSVLKYRYIRQGEFKLQEHLSDGRSVRYRIYNIQGPGVVDDFISRWTDTAYTSPRGRISGHVSDSNGQPIPNILVTAGGAQTISLSDGAYLLEGLPPGIHNLVAYSMDGTYRTFQQGAQVEAESTTPAPLQLDEPPLVTVVFTVIVPQDTPNNAKIRFAGNLYQLGNTYADLNGGVSSLATRMPVLAPLPDGRYSITLTLPAGTDLRYKYTLGDGLWNAEHTNSGDVHLRQLIVPENNVEINEMVDTWRSGGSAPINFDVSVPGNTPANEIVSIQFNPGYGWMEPIPMWPNQNSQEINHWQFVLTGPLDIIGSLRYRYCREDQCGSADDASTMGPNPTGRTINSSRLSQAIIDQVDSWAWLPATFESATVPGFEIPPRDENFMAGVEFLPYYHPSMSSRIPNAISDVNSLGANWLILTPTWTFTRDNPPVLEPFPAQDPLWPELTTAIIQARNLGLNVGLLPSPQFNIDIDEWWEAAPRDFTWWHVWFERIGTFFNHHADMAARYGASSLILGGDWIKPAYPDGKLADGTPSNVPEDTDTRWQTIFEGIRARYRGPISWVLRYPEDLKNPPSFIESIDQVYIIWSAPLSDNPDATREELIVEAGRLLDDDVLPFIENLNKPVILVLAYPSAEGGTTGCVADNDGHCVEFELLNRPNPDVDGVSIDYIEQAKAYNAMFAAINTRDWIQGVVSQGYYPPVTLLDKSISVHGKPSSGVLWFWYPKFLGN